MSTHCITRFVDCDELEHWPPNNGMIATYLTNDTLKQDGLFFPMVYGKAREIVCAWRHHDGNPAVHGGLLKNILTRMHELDNEYSPSSNGAGHRTAYAVQNLERTYDVYAQLMPAGTHHIGEHFTYVVYFGSRRRIALQVIVCRYLPDSGTSHRENIYFGPLDWFIPDEVEALAYPSESEEDVSRD